MEARGLSANKLALALRVPSGRITQILHGKRSITPETALRLGAYFGNIAQFWLTLQMRYDLTPAALMSSCANTATIACNRSVPYSLSTLRPHPATGILVFVAACPPW